MSEAAVSTRNRSLVEGEFLLSRADFVDIARMLYEDSGIVLSDAKATLVYSRLGKRLRKLGLSSFAEYREIVAGPDGGSERQIMLSALTTNVTRFFREPHHFEHLKTRVLPALITSAKAGNRIRIWSSACSTGEEPYSIALTLLEMLPDVAKYDIRILATDIDPRVVDTGRTGHYRDEALEPVSRAMRDRWFERAESGWIARPELRSLVLFKELNLIGPWPVKGPFDFIFCRNVVIYFDDATQSALWHRFRDVLAPGGRLYVGHSERVDIEGFDADGQTIYRRKGSLS